LTKKDALCIWSPACERVFKKLKKSSMSIPVLCHFDGERNFVIKNDTFDLVVVGVLLQHNDKVILYLVAHISRKHSPTEINYKIQGKELLIIICTFKGLYSLLDCSLQTIDVISDCQNQTYIIINWLLNYCETH
jgi:hypothetical protein